MKNENKKLHTQICNDNKPLELDMESLNVLTELFELLIETDIKQKKKERVKMSEVYMQYICKNCDCIYLDKDVKGRITPIKGYYCPDCVEKYGFVNPPQRPKKKLSNKQKEILNKNIFLVRKNSNKNNSNIKNNNEGLVE